MFTSGGCESGGISSDSPLDQNEDVRHVKPLVSISGFKLCFQAFSIANIVDPSEGPPRTAVAIEGSPTISPIHSPISFSAG